MSLLPLTLAISHYDHVTELVTGRVPVEGVELTCLNLQIEEIFFRQFTYRDFDVSEVSMGKYCSLVSQGDAPLVAIPVFPSRVPRHSSIYIRRDGPVKTPADLAGKTHRHSGMGADRVGLFARLAPAPIWHRPDVDPMGAGRRRPAGPAGEGQAQAAARHPIRVAAGQEPERHAGVGRDRRGAVGASAACFEHGHPNVARLFRGLP